MTAGGRTPGATSGTWTMTSRGRARDVQAEDMSAGRQAGLAAGLGGGAAGGSRGAGAVSRGQPEQDEGERIEDDGVAHGAHRERASRPASAGRQVGWAVRIDATTSSWKGGDHASLRDPPGASPGYGGRAHDAPTRCHRRGHGHGPGGGSSRRSAGAAACRPGHPSPSTSPSATSIDFEAGVAGRDAVRRRRRGQAGEIGGCEAAVAMHIGPYDTLGETYAELAVVDHGSGPHGLSADVGAVPHRPR